MLRSSSVRKLFGASGAVAWWGESVSLRERSFGENRWVRTWTADQPRNVTRNSVGTSSGTTQMREDPGPVTECEISRLTKSHLPLLISGEWSVDFGWE